MSSSHPLSRPPPQSFQSSKAPVRRTVFGCHSVTVLNGLQVDVFINGRPELFAERKLRPCRGHLTNANLASPSRLSVAQLNEVKSGARISLRSSGLRRPQF
jgi:hypothetical protein